MNNEQIKIFALAKKYTNEEISDSLMSVYTLAGSCTFAELPPLEARYLGFICTVTEDFTTTSDFVEGSGKNLPAGTNVTVVNNGTKIQPVYKYDASVGDLSSFQTKKLNTTVGSYETVEAALAGHESSLNNKVDKINGKGLSTNDFTNTLKNKLDSIEENAQVNTVTGVKGVKNENPKTGSVILNLTDLVDIGSNLSFDSESNTLAADDQRITVDSVLSIESENPVQNKVIKDALDAKVTAVSGKGLSTNDYSDADKTIVDNVTNALSEKVDKVNGKVLSDNNYTTAEKNKLDGIAEGAEVNVQSDWNESNSSADSYIKNKPILGTASTKNFPSSGNAAAGEVVLGNDSRLSDSRNAADVYSWAKASTKPSYNATEVGAIASSLKGANNGVAELDSNGKVPSSQLPSFVDDVLEYSSKSAFPATGESGKIYVDTTANLTYRWTGTQYTEISKSLAIGETSSTAFAGNRGKAIENKIPSHASTSNKLATQNDLTTTKEEIYADKDSFAGYPNNLSVTNVNTLPTTNIDDTTIYTVPVSGTSPTQYKLYVWSNSAWKQIGTV